jgi:hypothetical protein
MAEEWARIALGYWDHPKIARAGGATAGETHQRMIFYCKKHPGTHGVVPLLSSPVLSASRKTIRGLEAEGLIVRERDGWRVRDVEVWQTLGEPEPAIPAGTSPEAARERTEDAARARSLSEIRREAGRSGGLKSAVSRSKQNQANGEANGGDPASKPASKHEANVARGSGSSGSSLPIDEKKQEPRDAREGQANDDCAGWGEYRDAVPVAVPIEPWRCAERAYASWHRGMNLGTWKAASKSNVDAMKALAEVAAQSAIDEAKHERELVDRALANFGGCRKAKQAGFPPSWLVSKWHYYLNPPDVAGLAPPSPDDAFQPGVGAP